MRILVCGGRDYNNQSEVEYQLGGIHNETPIKHVIAGAANGADTLAVRWAKDEHIKVTEFPANWKKYGKRAGYIRNKNMLEQGNPDMVVAFPGGRGTEMMCRLADDAGVCVNRVTI